jgi:Uncharacterized conserved protein
MKDSNKVVFNARAESLTEKSMFKNSLSNRCLIPATSFYEFDKEKKKYRIKVTKLGLIYLAGLWKHYLYQGDKIYCFCIITTTPNELIGQIHSRMPAIIPPERTADWFKGSMESLGLLQSFNQPMLINAI